MSRAFAGLGRLVISVEILVCTPIGDRCVGRWLGRPSARSQGSAISRPDHLVSRNTGQLVVAKRNTPLRMRVLSPHHMTCGVTRKYYCQDI